MKYDYESVDSKGTTYRFINNGDNIIVYEHESISGISQNDKFLRTILKDIKDLRELKDMETIKDTIKKRDANYNIKQIDKN